MNATGKKRLLKLADFLQTVKPKRFDMGFFATGDLHECGTAGCALGWATMVPSFQKAGLYLDDGMSVRFKGSRVHDSFRVAEKFFDLTEREAENFFLRRENHETPKQVARNIRAAVKAA